MAGEAGRVGEDVEHVAAPVSGGHAGAVLGLIEVEPGLVPPPGPHRQPHAGLVDDDFVWTLTIEPAGRRLEALQVGHRRLVHADHGQVTQPRAQRRDDAGALPRHAKREALHHQHRAVAIDDQAREAVGLAPHEPHRLAPAALPRLRGGRYPACHEATVERLVLPRVNPAAQRRPRVVESAPDEATARVDDRDGRPGRDVTDIGHVGLEDPGMRVRPAIAAALESEDGVPGHEAELTRRWRHSRRPPAQQPHPYVVRSASQAPFASTGH